MDIDSNSETERNKEIESKNKIRIKFKQIIQNKNNSEKDKKSNKYFSNKKKQSESDSNSEDYVIIKNINKRKKYKKTNLKLLNINDYESKEIFGYNNINKIPLIKTLKIDDTTIKAEFLYISECKNKIYYNCYKKKFKCERAAKIEKINKKFIITSYCDTNIEHMKLDYAELKDLLEKKFNESNHKETYVQRMFVQYIIKSKNIDDYLSINKNFVDDSGENIELSKNQIYKINRTYTKNKSTYSRFIY